MMITLAQLRDWHQTRHDKLRDRMKRLEGEMQRRGWSVTQEKCLRDALREATFHQAAVNAIDEEGR